jgi:hypothetical protein
MAVQRGRSERRGESYSVPYVEPLSDARTKLADFFSILLELPQREHEDPTGHIRDKTGTEDRNLRPVR